MCGSSGTRAMRVIGARSRAASPPELMTLLLSLTRILPIPLKCYLTCRRRACPCPRAQEPWRAAHAGGPPHNSVYGLVGGRAEMALFRRKKDFGRGLKAETERTWKTPRRECA